MKSGSNAWHGDARWVRHTAAFDAANFFADGTGATPLRNMQFGGTLGGPIIKDKTFFFVYYEGQRYASFATKRFNVPNAADFAAARTAIADAGLTTSPIGETLLSYFPQSPSTTPGDNLVAFNTPTTAKMDTFGFKIDQKITNNLQLSGRYIFGDSLQAAPSGSVPAVGQADLFNSVAPSRAQMAGLSLTWNLSPNKVLESRLGWTRFSQIIKVNNKIDPKSLGIDTGPLSTATLACPTPTCTVQYLYWWRPYVSDYHGA